MGSITFLALMLASAMPDLVDALYWLVNVCNPYGLYSHTTYAVLLEASIIGGIALLATGSRGVALLFVGVVLLHSPADYFTGRKLYVPGGEMFGLRFYERPLLDWLLEVPLLTAGWWVLRRNGGGPRWAASVWTLVLLLILQTTLDVFVIGRGGSLKPNACPVIAPPADI